MASFRSHGGQDLQTNSKLCGIVVFHCSKEKLVIAAGRRTNTKPTIIPRAQQIPFQSAKLWPPGLVVKSFNNFVCRTSRENRPLKIYNERGKYICKQQSPSSSCHRHKSIFRSALVWLPGLIEGPLWKLFVDGEREPWILFQQWGSIVCVVNDNYYCAYTGFFK